MEWFAENWEHLLAAFGGVVLASSALVKALAPLAEMTPTQADDRALAKAKVWLDKVLDVLRALAVRGRQ